MLRGKTYLVPYLRPFPVWKYGPVYDFLTGHDTGEMAWQPEWFGRWEFDTLEQAQTRVAAC